VAAVLILLVTIASFHFFPMKTCESSEIFQSYYSTYPAIMTFRSSVDQSELEMLLFEAFSFYDDENYKMASRSFIKVLKIDDKNYMSQFYLSMCEIENNNFKSAKKYLSELVLIENHVFLEQSNWFLALVCIKQDEYIEAKKILKKVIKENMTEKDMAKKLLKALK
jgi:tetratricopeptide (TPR) repeat protein